MLVSHSTVCVSGTTRSCVASVAFASVAFVVLGSSSLKNAFKAPAIVVLGVTSSVGFATTYTPAGLLRSVAFTLVWTWRSSLASPSSCSVSVMPSSSTCASGPA